MTSPIRIVSIDIETVSQGKRASDYTDLQPLKLGNVKDPEKVRLATIEKRDEARDKHGLNWWTGSVVSVALVDVYHSKDNKVFYGFDEGQVLVDLSKELNLFPMKLFGKSSKGFDFPFLVGRYMANRIPVPRVLKERSALFDVDDFFGFSSGHNQRGKLQDYAHGMNMPGKLMNGSRVQSLYNQIIDAKMRGATAEVIELWSILTNYNIDDALKVADMIRLYYGEPREGI